MTPGSFNVTLLTEGADRYSLRLISPIGYTTDPGTDDPDTFRMYSLYLLKGVVNSEGKVEGETVMFPGKDCRFHVEHWDEEAKDVGRGRTTFQRVPCLFILHILVKEGNTVVYKLITLCSISRAVHANAGEFATVMGLDCILYTRPKCILRCSPYCRVAVSAVTLSLLLFRSALTTASSATNTAYRNSPHFHVGPEP